MQVEDGEDGASAGRGEGGADAPAAGARPSEHAAAPARPATADAIKEMMLALERGHQARSGVPGGGSTDDAAGSGPEGQQGSGTHLAGQVAVAGDGALVNIGKERKRAKKGTGSSASVQDIARRVREWNIQKPPSAKHSAWRWAFKYKHPPKNNPAGYEHQALCSLCLQAKNLERATIKLGKSDSPTALMQHLHAVHPEAHQECWELEEQRNPAKNPVAVQLRRSPRKHSSNSHATSHVDTVRASLSKLFEHVAPSSSQSQASSQEHAASGAAPARTQGLHAHMPTVQAASSANKGPDPLWPDLLATFIAEEFLPLTLVEKPSFIPGGIQREAYEIIDAALAIEDY